MRYFATLILVANTLFAADFLTGQAARAIVGQVTFTAQGAPPSNTTVGASGGLAYVNGTLLVVDDNRMSALPEDNRVLIYRNIDGQIPSITANIPAQPIGAGIRCPVCGFTADAVLGQPNFTSSDPATTRTGMWEPTAVASDGVRVAVADTNNNRVLIWNTMPQTSGTQPDLVLGQPDFVTGTPNTGTGNVNTASAKTFRGPEGVWIQNGKLFVADNQNHRVLIWNTFPTQNFQNADVVVGQPDFATVTENSSNVAATYPNATNLLNPVSVSSDGVRMFVADLGHHRVLIWNHIPTQNYAPADVAVGQPDLISGIPDNTSYLVSVNTTTGVAVFGPVMCASNGVDSNNNPTFPDMCGATLDSPRFALSDGTRLFVADGGNDRVLIFNHIPTSNQAGTLTQNGTPEADVVLGQIDEFSDETSDDASSNPTATIRAYAADAIRTPTSLAWDSASQSLFVADPFEDRILVYSPGASTALPAVRNAASMEVFAIGSIQLSGTITAGDELTAEIGNTTNSNVSYYTYKVLSSDTLATITTAIANLINSANSGKGDPQVIATADTTIDTVVLTARVPGPAGDDITVTGAATPSTATESGMGNNLFGGGNAAVLAAGTLITIFGQNFTDAAYAAGTDDPLPTSLGGVQVYVDGRQAPLLYVSPNQINAQVPMEVAGDTPSVESPPNTSSSLYIRMQNPDGSVSASTAVGLELVEANPGIFAFAGPDPRVAVAVHESNNAVGSVQIAGEPDPGNLVSITVGVNTYTYTAQPNDTLDTVMNALVAQIHANDPLVDASPSNQFDFVRLTARVPGPAGEGIPYSATGNGNMTVIANTSALCCANVAGAPVTPDNPAVPGEWITVWVTGMGLINPPALFNLHTGMPYDGPVFNTLQAATSTEFFAYAEIAGFSANVLFAGMEPGAIGIARVDLELNGGLGSDPLTQVTIAQDIYVSNIATIPVKAPPPTVTSISPTSGAQGATNLLISITGTGFTDANNGTACSFGAGITVTSCVYNSTTSLTADLQIGSTATVGARDVVVTNPDGQSGTLPGGFTVTAN
jgi:uncharacterized protein (TIGR03437 family)